MVFAIQHEKFQGPIHLLLSLIEERKMHISEVSLAAVTQDFLAFVEREGGTLDDASQFVVVAATLLLVKARSLLPGLQVTDEESQSIQSLVNRVEMLRMVRERAKELAGEFDLRPIFTREVSVAESAPIFTPDATFSVAALALHIKELIAYIPKPEKLTEVGVRTVIRLEDVITNLVERFQQGVSYSFNAVLGKYKNASESEKKQFKHEAIVTFLALLELARKGIASLVQSEGFGEIEAKSLS